MPGTASRLGSKTQMVTGAAALVALSAAANMASPLYPVYQQIHEMSDPVMTLLYATFALTAMPALLLFGPAGDALGRCAVLIAGLVFASLGTILFGVDMAGVTGLFLGRVLLGIGLGLGTGAGIALMVEASPVSRPSLGSTLATISFVAGTGAGPMMAGVVADRTSAPTTIPFLVMQGVLVAVMAGVAMLREHRPVVRQRWRPTWPTVPISLRPSFAVAALTGFLGWSAVGIFLALVPSLARSVLEEPSLTMIGVLVGTVLFVSALSQLFAHRFSPRLAQTLGLTALACGMVLLLAAHLPIGVEGGASIMMAIAAVTTGIGHGFGYWGANQEVNSQTASSEHAGVAAALYLAFYAGAGLPAVAVGVLAAGSSTTSAVLLISLVLVLMTIAFLPVPGMFRPAQSPRRFNSSSTEPFDAIGGTEAADRDETAPEVAERA